MAFQAYADDAGRRVLTTPRLAEPSWHHHGTARNGKPEIQDGVADTKERRRHLRHRVAQPTRPKWAQRNPANDWGSIEIAPGGTDYAADRPGGTTRNGEDEPLARA
jgi:hypothetical protein